MGACMHMCACVRVCLCVCARACVCTYWSFMIKMPCFRAVLQLWHWSLLFPVNHLDLTWPLWQQGGFCLTHLFTSQLVLYVKMMSGHLTHVLMVLSCSLCLRTRHHSIQYSQGDCFVLTLYSVEPLSFLRCENSMEELSAVLEECFCLSSSMESPTVRRTLSVYLQLHSEEILQRLSDETLCGKPAMEILIVFSNKTKGILSCACTQLCWVYIASTNIVYNSRAFQLVNDKCSCCCTTFTGYVEDLCIAMKIPVEPEVCEDDKLCNEHMLSNPWWATFAVNVAQAIHLHFQYGHCGQVVHCVSIRNWIIVNTWCHNIVMEQNLVIVRVRKDSMGQPLGERCYAAVGQVNLTSNAVEGNVTAGQFRNVWNVLQDCIIVDLFRNIWKKLQGNSSIGQSETTQDWLQRLATIENVYRNLFAISQRHIAVTVNTLQECLSAFVQFIDVEWTYLQDLITSASLHTHRLMYTLQGYSVAASQASDILIIFQEDFASIYQYRNHSESVQRACSYLAGAKSNDVVHHALYSWLYTYLIHIFVLASWLFYLSNQSEQERQRTCRVVSVTLLTKWHVVQIGMDLEPSQKFRKKWHRPSKTINTKHNWDSVLNDYIFHPWRTASLPPVRHRGESAKAASSCSSSLCCSCQQYVDMNLATMGRGRVMEVWPVTRFLPDATRNPSVDLSHVGYRLATLSVLPSSLPVSRIRLADAGFYSRGQGDEVMCFCCQARHSGWTARDNPIDVHRRLSPQCPHVQQRDREVAALAGGGGSAGGAAGLWPGQTSADDEEDGQGSHEEQDSRSLSLTTADSEVGPAPSPDLRTTSQTGNPTTVTAEPDVRRSEDMRTTTNETGTGQDARTNNNTRNPEDARTSNGTSSTAQSRSVFPRAGLDLGGAVYPMYQDMASRRRSFTNWDNSRAPPLDQVLLCGMFYAGECGLCGFCLLLLLNPLKSDIPSFFFFRVGRGGDIMQHASEHKKLSFSMLFVRNRKCNMFLC